MTSSVADVVLSLLAYRQSGNWQAYDRDFSKAIKFLNLTAHPLEIKKLRGELFWHLNQTGFIELFQTRFSTYWSRPPSSVVEIGIDEYGFIGLTNDALPLFQTLEAKIGYIKMEGPSLGGIPLFSNLPVIKARKDLVQEVCDSSGIPLTSNYQNKLFSFLPSMEQAAGSLQIGVTETSELFGDELEFFDFENGEWVKFERKVDLEKKLLRKKFEHGPPAFYLSRTSKSGVILTEIQNREWAQFIAAFSFKRKIKSVYKKTEQQLTILWPSARIRVPTLLERALRSGRLSPPERSQDGLTYSGLSERSIRTITSKGYPIEVEIE